MAEDGDKRTPDARKASGSTFELRPNQLARLLEMGRAEDAPRTDVVDDALAAELLHELLARPCPAVGAGGRAEAEAAPSAGACLVEGVCGPGAVGTLKALKDRGKALARTASTASERAAGTALYYGAIAAALVRHRHRITQLSCATLAEGFTDLEGRGWVPAELKELFRGARGACGGVG
jgi:hypothetical protein